ncbi:MAG: hypothetical protein ACSHX4_08395 [Opitutaceae bacterium]
MFKQNWKALITYTLVTCAMKLVAVGGAPDQISRNYYVTIDSIRMHGIMTNDHSTLDLSVAIKGQNKIRATFLTKQGSSTRTVYLLNGPALKEFHEVDGTLTESAASRLDSVTTLMDLIALNPDYHFQANNGFDLNSPILEGYTVELTREPGAYSGTDKHKPLHLQLFENNEGKRLIRSAHFVRFHKVIDPYFQPKEITFTDETTGVGATIIIDRYEYRSGIPEFLFDFPESAEKN